MATSNWGFDFTIVVGADLSAKQYRGVNVSGTLASSSSNGVGILQDKPKSGEHGSIRFLGVSKIYMPVSVGAGALVGFSDTSSGEFSIVGSTGIACGRILTGCDSGGIGTVYLFGGPINSNYEVYGFTPAADLSAQANKFVCYSGTLAGSQSQTIAGVLKTGAASGTATQVVRRGRVSLYVAISVGLGAYIGQSNTVSGAGATVTSGGIAWGSVAVAANSGGTAIVDLFGGPTYVAL